MVLRQYHKDIETFRPEFLFLHDIARHVSHSNEIIDVALETIDSLIYENDILSKASPSPYKEVPWEYEDIKRKLYFGRKSISATKLRCTSLSERLQNEINLVRTCTPRVQQHNGDLRNLQLLGIQHGRPKKQ
jgi:hypothetical protein